MPRSMPILLQSNMIQALKRLLSGRLSAIAESLPVGGTVCDVGTDHGILPMYLLQNHLAEKVIVTDLNPNPLARGKMAIEEAGLADRAEFILTDGILEVLPQKVDHFVIAGMGGETIVGILSRAEGKIASGTSFFLQPMTKIDCLRRYLYEKGFRITAERIVYENKKYFIIISAVFDGKQRTKTEMIYDYGEFLPYQKGNLIFTYYSSVLEKLNQKIKGMKNGNLDCSHEIEKKQFIQKVLEGLNENS